MIKPDSHYSTKKIYNSFKGPYETRSNFTYTLPNLLRDMNENRNSLEETVFQQENKIKFLVNELPLYKNISKPRITGSGSTVFIIFNKEKEVKEYENFLKDMKFIDWKKSTYLIL